MLFLELLQVYIASVQGMGYRELQCIAKLLSHFKLVNKYVQDML